MGHAGRALRRVGIEYLSMYSPRRTQALANERVAIIGGGIGGLATSLPLKHSPRENVIIERDPEPPDIAPQAAFDLLQQPRVPPFLDPPIVPRLAHSHL